MRRWREHWPSRSLRDSRRFDERRCGHAIRAANVCTLIAYLVVLLLATMAHAAPSSTRVLLEGNRTDPVYRRIESELGLLEIQIAREPGTASSRSPSSDSNRGEPAAVVHVEPTRVSIRLGHRHGGGELVVQRRPGHSPGIVALAAVELLRARIVHARKPAGATEQAGPSSPRTSAPSENQSAPGGAPATASAGPAARPWGLFVGPGIAASAGGFPATSVLHVAADWRSHIGLYAAARLLPGLSRASWEVAAGRCTQRIGWAGAAGGYAWMFVRDQLGLALGAGGGLLRSSYQTVPDAANRASEALSGAQWTGMLHLETFLAWYPIAHVGLALSGLVGTATSSIDLPDRARALPETSRADQPRTSFGRPLGLVSLGLAARL